MSTALEQDFTIEGIKGHLGCPFSVRAPVSEAQDESGIPEGHEVDVPDPTPHQSSDPICAAMFEETTSQPAPSAGVTASKCPIRYLDQHSPEEIAHYVETHKHELPRSHEVCLRRYNRNEEQIKKLDAKYGSLVSMIQGLSELHQPMLPLPELQRQNEVDRSSNMRVESWAQDVSLTATDRPDSENGEELEDPDLDRQSHFDRPLKEVRVGESPSRPWGISVPVYEPVYLDDDERPVSPPPAPVMMPESVQDIQSPVRTERKCPFDHTKLGHAMNGKATSSIKNMTKAYDIPPPVHNEPPPTPKPAANPEQAAFINLPEVSQTKPQGGPQMLFTGPVFIGYPIEQAIQFMQHFQQRG
jgi:hypothetical protein